LSTEGEETFVIKSSVVVPVFNAGRYLEPLVESLLRQTMPREDFEVILVDDGSTDGSGARLDELAGTYGHFVVRHQENSGWPGKPRNVGTDLARGEFVFFADQDDELGPEALERMYRFASANESEILLPKVAGTMIGANPVFPANVKRCSYRDAADILIKTSTPHKLFRRSFLIEHQLRFPEGKRRLEDALFMVQAYLRARNISILADYPCYYWQRRDDDRNNSKGAPDLFLYYGRYLQEVLDVILAETEPGPLQDILLRRFYRTNMLGRLREPPLLRYSEPYRRKGYDAVRELASYPFPPGVVQGLPAISRLRAELLERDSLEGLVEFARRCEPLRPHAELIDICWRDGGLVVESQLWLDHADGTPVVVVERSGRYLLDPRLTAGVPGLENPEGWDVGDPLFDASAQGKIHDADSDTWWYAPAPFQAKLRAVEGRSDVHQVVLVGNARIDPLRVAHRPLVPGSCRVRLSFQTLGHGRDALVAANTNPAQRSSPPLAILGTPPRVVVPRLTPAGDLILDVDPPPPRLLAEYAKRGVGPAWVSEHRLHATLPVHTSPRIVDVKIGRDGAAGRVRGRLEPAGNGAVLSVPDAVAVKNGRYPAELDLLADLPALPLGTVSIRRGRITSAHPPHGQSPAHTLTKRARRIVTRALFSPPAGQCLHRVIEALPAPYAAKTRHLARRVRNWLAPKK